MENRTTGNAFPRFVTERELKAGDRSFIHLVRDKETGKRYICRSFTGSGDVYREMIGIDCPYLPRVYEVREENGTVHVLEEYIQGDTLAFLLECGPLTADHARQILTHICQGLKVLHGVGAVHRDIKPENIILRGSDAVLIDFDAARIFRAERDTDTQILGTTGYAAPEQYGFSQTDARTDIYALGILLNEMLTGQHPSRQLAEGGSRPIIEKCTQINAKQRYASVSELMAAIDAPPKSKKVACRVVAVSLFVFLLFAGGGLLYRSRPQEAPAIQTEPFTTWQPEGSAEGYATTFHYDMDGDGLEEEYLFGVDFLGSPHENVVHYEICDIRPGERPSRDIHCCVWRVNSDGSMEVAEGFISLLADVRSDLRLVDGPGDPEQTLARPDYRWPGMISAAFVPEQDSAWLYEVSAYLDGLELTAQASFRFIPREVPK